MTRWPMVGLFTAAMWLGCGKKTAQPPAKVVIVNVGDQVTIGDSTYIVGEGILPYEVPPNATVKPVKR